MSRSVNRVTLLGSLGRDADVKHTPSGACVANFSIATERNWKDKQSGEWKKETDWHNIVMWQADKVGQYLTKGKSVYVEGRLQTRSYEKDGVKRYTTEIVVDNLILLGGGGESAPHNPPAASKQEASSDYGEVSDEDVPF